MDGVRVHIATPIDSIDLSQTLSDLIDCNDWGLLACQECKMAHLQFCTSATPLLYSARCDGEIQALSIDFFTRGLACQTYHLRHCDALRPKSVRIPAAINADFGIRVRRLAQQACSRTYRHKACLGPSARLRRLFSGHSGLLPIPPHSRAVHAIYL